MKKLKYWCALLAAAGILLRSEAAVAGAQRAMSMWISSVAPALFPFLVLMPVLTGPEACAAYEALFSSIMRPVFGLPGSAAPAVVIGMISGSPGGALAVVRIASQTGMPVNMARRIAMSVCGLSPAYLILGVGQGLYGSVKTGMQLAGIQAAVQLMLLFLLRTVCRDMKSVAGELPQAMNGHPIRNAVETVLCVCGYMVFFSSLAEVAAAFVGESAGKLLLLAVDLPSGLPELLKWEIPAQELLRGMGLGFGGLCIAVQNLDALKAIGMKTKPYLAARGIAAALTALLGAALRPAQAFSAAFPGGSKSTYAFSLLIAMIIAIPALIVFSKNLFLNKTKDQKLLQ